MTQSNFNSLALLDGKVRRWRPLKNTLRDRVAFIDDKLCSCKVVRVYEDCVYLALFDRNGAAVRAFRIHTPVHDLCIDELI